MRSTLVTSSALVALLSAISVSADITFQTPSLTQCQSTELKYGGGEGSYGLYVMPSEDPCADSLIDIPEQTGTSYKWKCNLPAGAKVQFLVEDDEQNEAWTGVITVQPSNDASCVDAAAKKQIDLVQTTATNTTSSSSSSSPAVAQPIANAGAGPSTSSSGTASNGASTRLSTSLGALVAALALGLTQI